MCRFCLRVTNCPDQWPSLHKKVSKRDDPSNQQVPWDKWKCWTEVILTLKSVKTETIYPACKSPERGEGVGWGGVRSRWAENWSAVGVTVGSPASADKSVAVQVQVLHLPGWQYSGWAGFAGILSGLGWGRVGPCSAVNCIKLQRIMAARIAMHSTLQRSVNLITPWRSPVLC